MAVIARRTANQRGWKTSKSPRLFIGSVRKPKVPALDRSQAVSNMVSPRMAAGTWGSSTPTRLIADSTASSTMANRTLVKSHQTARNGFSRPNERDQPRRAAGGAPAPGSVSPASSLLTIGLARHRRGDYLGDALLELALFDCALDVGPV